jgi:hypothetical protein
LGKANDLAGLPRLPPDHQAKLPGRDTAHAALYHIRFIFPKKLQKQHEYLLSERVSKGWVLAISRQVSGVSHSLMADGRWLIAER